MSVVDVCHYRTKRKCALFYFIFKGHTITMYNYWLQCLILYYKVAISAMDVWSTLFKTMCAVGRTLFIRQTKTTARNVICHLKGIFFGMHYEHMNDCFLV